MPVYIINPFFECSYNMSSSDSSTESDSSDDELIMEAFFQPVDDDDEIQILLRACRSSSSESESSVEELPRKTQKLNMNYEKTISAFTDKEFKEHFRVARHTFNFITEIVGQSKFLSYKRGGRENLPIPMAVLMALCYLSNKTFRQLSEYFGVTVSCAHATVSRVINSLVTLSSEYIQWPSEAETVSIENAFFNMQGIHGILGSIGCQYAKEDLNKSNRFIPLQAVSDHRKKFTYISCGNPGFHSDTEVLFNSPLYEKICDDKLFRGNENELFLIGNSTYPNLSWLVTPFRDTGQLSGIQEDFNYRHSASGIIIREAFDLLMGRFRYLQSFKNKNIKFVADCIIASCVLHNICIDRDDLISVSGEETEENDNIYCAEDCDDDRRTKLILEMYS